MIVWRLCKEEYSKLSGIGAYLYGGRWNSPGYSVIYTASHLSLACLEVIPSLASQSFPEGFVSLKISIPEAISIISLELEDFPKNWKESFSSSWFKEKGNQWSTSKKSLVLSVPSVIIPSERNILLNPEHPDMEKVRILSKDPFRFDPRLLKE